MKHKYSTELLEILTDNKKQTLFCFVIYGNNDILHEFLINEQKQMVKNNYKKRSY